MAKLKGTEPTSNQHSAEQTHPPQVVVLSPLCHAPSTEAAWSQCAAEGGSVRHQLAQGQRAELAWAASGQER